MRALAFRSLLVASALAVIAVVSPWQTHDALAQEPASRDAPGARAAAPSRSTELSRVLGVLAWRRAVWTSDARWYDRAASDLSRVRAEKGEATDFTTLFLLGHSFARTSRRAEADAAWRAAQALVGQSGGDFPGFLLAEALYLTSDKPAHEEQPGTEKSRDILTRFLTEIARYDRSRPFAAELLYLGLLERGLRNYALGDFETVFRDLERARALVKAEGRQPAIELMQVLIQSRKDVQEFGVAAELADEAIHRQPGEAAHYFVRGIVAAEAKDDDEARRWHERALELKIDYAEPRAKLGFHAHERADLPGMRRHLEAYDAILQEQWIATRDARNPQTASNLYAGWGMYWSSRGDAASDAGDMEGERAHWARAKDAYLKAYTEEPGCVRALVSLVRVLSWLGAPREEVETWTKRAEELRDAKPGAPKGYRDTFC